MYSSLLEALLFFSRARAAAAGRGNHYVIFARGGEIIGRGYVCMYCYVGAAGYCVCAVRLCVYGESRGARGGCAVICGQWCFNDGARLVFARGFCFSVGRKRSVGIIRLALDFFE